MAVVPGLIVRQWLCPTHLKLIVGRWAVQELTSNVMQPEVGAAGMRCGSEGGERCRATEAAVK